MRLLKKILIIILSLIFLIIIAFNLYNYISIKFLHKPLPSVNGYAILEVVSGSMEPNIKVGDLIIIDKKHKDYKVGDIITFTDQNNSFVTHRIVEIEDDYYITKGDNNNSIDQDKLTKDKIQGKYIKRLKNMGRIISSIKNPITLILILFIGIIACIITSIDKEGNIVGLTEDEEEYIEFQEYVKNKEKNGNTEIIKIILDEDKEENKIPKTNKHPHKKKKKHKKK